MSKILTILQAFDIIKTSTKNNHFIQLDLNRKEL